MAQSQPKAHRLRSAGVFLGAALLLWGGADVLASNGPPTDPGVLSVPAEFGYALRLPGMGDQIRRPSAVFVDHAHGEVLVGDSGLNRLLIFDREGLYRYAFNFTDQVGSVVDLCVDSSGFVYVLGTAREGRRILKYDFDGVFLEEVVCEGIGAWEIESITVDAQDRIVVIGIDGMCSVVESTGQIVHRFDTMVSLPDASALEVVRGKPRVHQGRLYLPASAQGYVLVFELATGEPLPVIGVPGNTPGQFNFPVAVDVLPSGVVVVLDKMRFNVLCFAPSGRFLGEFGGKGFRNGWLYHPTLLAAVSDDKVVVGQILDQRVQVLHVPDFVFERLPREPESGRREVLDGSGEGSPDTDPRSP